MRRHKESGVSLIEVLVAVLVTATGVLGAASMQINAVRYNQAANTRSTAVFLANDISDRMRANRANALAGTYNIALAADAPTGNLIYQQDVREWLQEVANRLPGGDGAVSQSNTTFTITLQWNESRLAKSREDNAGETESFVFITEL